MRNMWRRRKSANGGMRRHNQRIMAASRRNIAQQQRRRIEIWRSVSAIISTWQNVSGGAYLEIRRKQAKIRHGVACGGKASMA